MRYYRTADEYKAHRDARQEIIDRWVKHEITMAEKRQLLTEETAFFEGRGRTYVPEWFDRESA